MSHRGPRIIFSDIESDSDNSLDNTNPDSPFDRVENVNFNLRPPTLILNSDNSNAQVNMVDDRNPAGVPPNAEGNSASNSAGNPAGNVAYVASTSISEIKEFLEMVPIFRGEPELLSLFIKESEKIINYFYDVRAPNSARNDFITSRIRSKIQGEAALFLANKNISNWDELRQSLIAAYADKRDDATLAIEIVKLEQGHDSPFEFYKKLQKLLNAQICYANLNYGTNDGLNKHFERVALKTLLNGLKDPLGSLMRTKDPQDLDVALNLLTNTYQKEINQQKFNRTIPVNNIQKPRLNFPRSSNYTPNYSSSFAVQPNNFANNQPLTPNTNTNPTNFYRSPAPKRPANFYPNFGNQSQTFTRHNQNQPTPMSTSTTNTYRPPTKVRPQQNFNAHEVYDIDEQEFYNLNINNEHNDEHSEQNVGEFTPYNNFLEETAPDQIQPQ